MFVCLATAIQGFPQILKSVWDLSQKPATCVFTWIDEDQIKWRLGVKYGGAGVKLDGFE